MAANTRTPGNKRADPKAGPLDAEERDQAGFGHRVDPRAGDS